MAMNESAAGSYAPPEPPLTSPLMTLTEAAATRLAALYAKGGQSKFLRIGVDTKGCSGLSYRMSWADAAGPGDEAVTEKGVTLLIDRTAAPFLAGSVMDYEVGGLSSGFTFANPNEKGRCGCGGSFRV